jgi:hypothetical protein
MKDLASIALASLPSSSDYADHICSSVVLATHLTLRLYVRLQHSSLDLHVYMGVTILLDGRDKFSNYKSCVQLRRSSNVRQNLPAG